MYKFTAFIIVRFFISDALLGSQNESLLAGDT